MYFSSNLKQLDIVSYELTDEFLFTCYSSSLIDEKANFTASHQSITTEYDSSHPILYRALHSTSLLSCSCTIKTLHQMKTIYSSSSVSCFVLFSCTGSYLWRAAVSHVIISYQANEKASDCPNIWEILQYGPGYLIVKNQCWQYG